MKAQIQVYEQPADVREAMLDKYELQYQEWIDKDQYAKGEMPERPDFPVRFCMGKIDVSELTAFYIINAEIIRIETKNNYYSIKNTPEALDKLNKLIPD